MGGVCYADGEDAGAAEIASGDALDCRWHLGGPVQAFRDPSG